MPSPRVSVLSSWFNRPQDIIQSVRSVLDQDGIDFEYVIVDDASTDGETIDHLLRMADADRRLTVLLNDRNIGFTRSLCRAAATAKGEYVALHDAGDISLPGRLLRQVQFLDGNPGIVAAGGGVVNVNLANGKRTRIQTMTSDPTLGVEGWLFTHGEVMFRRSMYERVGGYRPAFYYSQDSDLWRRLAEHGELGAVDETIYERRTFADGVEGNPRRMVCQAIFGNLAFVCAEARKAGKPDPIERFNTLALLDQPQSERFQNRAYTPILELLKRRRFSEAQDCIARVPAGMLTSKMLIAYTLLRLRSAVARKWQRRASASPRSRRLRQCRGDRDEAR